MPANENQSKFQRSVSLLVKIQILIDFDAVTCKENYILTWRFVNLKVKNWLKIFLKISKCIEKYLKKIWKTNCYIFRSSAGNLDEEQQTVVEDDESILDNALDNGVFHWLLQAFLPSKTLKTEEFYKRRFHQLLTDLIVLMPLKVSYFITIKQ